MSEEVESEAVETAYSKGLNLEKQFSEFLKSDLGWEKTVIRPQMASAINMRGTNVDIVAQRQDFRGENLQKLGRIYLVVFGFGLAMALLNWDADWAEPVAIFSVFLEIIGLVALQMSKSRHIENAWVECKNRKTKSDIRQIQQVIADYAAYNQSGISTYKFVQVYFVSASGFVENAIRLAEQHNIKCYSLRDGKFVEETFWK